MEKTKSITLHGDSYHYVICNGEFGAIEITYVEGDTGAKHWISIDPDELGDILEALGEFVV